MKCEMTETTKHGKPVLKYVARIEKSKKHGIPRSYQRTWSVHFDEHRSMYEQQQIKRMFEAQSARWLSSVMLEIFGDKKPDPIQLEAMRE